MKRLISILAIWLILPMTVQTVSAQNPKQKLIDSLLTELKTVQEDTNKVDILNILSQYAGWRVGHYDTARHFANEALVLARQLDFIRGESVAYSNIGIAYANQGKYSEALKSFLAALKTAEEIGRGNGIGYAYGNIGNIYAVQGNYSEALKNYFAALKIYEEVGNKHGMGSVYNNIGGIYLYQNDYSEAIKNYSAGLKIREEVEDKGGMANSFTNIGSVYNQQGNYSEALKNYEASLKIAEEIEDKSGIASAYNGLGMTYANQHNDSEALKNSFAALKIAEEIGHKRVMAISYNNIGTVYARLNKVQESREWLQKCLALSKEIGAKENIKAVYHHLAIADSISGNFKSAFENYKRFILYKDSLYNEENTKKLTQAEMLYEFDKRQLADSIKSIEVQNLITARLHKQQVYTWTGFGIGMLLIGFLIFVFRNNKKLSKEKQKSESLLLNILPEEIAGELKEKGSAEAKQFDEVSILFTDFVNFTQTAEKLQPQQLVQELNECFTAFDNIIERNGLEKIKTIGDAYLAVCGLPSPHPKHAQKIVQAALEIQHFIEERKNQKSTFQIRIGIHSGSVVAGIVGVKKFAYDIWGDTVNTAARMEQSGEPGKVNISGVTYELVKEEFNCIYRGEVAAKNKGMMKMYFIE